nr:DUF3304 domain-containing protein [Pseudoduganella ginsengisoli]
MLGLLVGSAHAGLGKSTVPVSVHGVNYSNEEFSYTVEDPTDAKNKAGGETINRFGAGGTMCCYDLPKQWKPGMQVKVNSTHWLPKQADGKIPEVKQSFLVEMPPYVDGKPGELWILRQVDGSVKVVSSDYQPDHEKWPGEVKGWPVPSNAYVQERQRLYLSLAESDVTSSKALLVELEKDPVLATEEAWKIRSKYSPKDLAGFVNASDPKFKEWLRDRYQRSLRLSEERVKRLKESMQ